MIHRPPAALSPDLSSGRPNLVGWNRSLPHLMPRKIEQPISDFKGRSITASPRRGPRYSRAVADNPPMDRIPARADQHKRAPLVIEIIDLIREISEKQAQRRGTLNRRRKSSRGPCPSIALSLATLATCVQANGSASGGSRSLAGGLIDPP